MGAMHGVVLRSRLEKKESASARDYKKRRNPKKDFCPLYVICLTTSSSGTK